MSLATSCPSCGTVFRVVQDQLKTSEGWVRCGHCQEVFNALEGLFDLNRRAASPAPAGSPPPAQPELATPANADPNDPAWAETRPAMFSDSKVLRERQESLQARTPIAPPPASAAPRQPDPNRVEISSRRTATWDPSINDPELGQLPTQPDAGHWASTRGDMAPGHATAPAPAESPLRTGRLHMSESPDEDTSPDSLFAPDTAPGDSTYQSTTLEFRSEAFSPLAAASREHLADTGMAQHVDLPIEPPPPTAATPVAATPLPAPQARVQAPPPVPIAPPVPASVPTPAPKAVASPPPLPAAAPVPVPAPPAAVTPPVTAPAPSPVPLAAAPIMPPPSRVVPPPIVHHEALERTLDLSKDRDFYSETTLAMDFGDDRVDLFRSEATERAEVKSHRFGAASDDPGRDTWGDSFGTRTEPDFSEAPTDLPSDHPNTATASAAAAEPDAPTPPPVAAEDAAALPDFVRRADSRARWQRPWVRAGLGMLALGLAGGLAVQAAYQWHDMIAARWPMSRPLMVSLCERMACEVRPPRQLDALVVDSTTLTRPPGVDGFQLGVTLHNRVNYAIAAPHIELSLTDMAGVVVLRRVLSPADFRQTTALAAQSDVAWSLTFTSANKRIVGYTLAAFYP